MFALTGLQAARWNNSIFSVTMWEDENCNYPSVRVFKGFPGTDNLRLNNYEGSPFCKLKPDEEFRLCYLDPCEHAMRKAFVEVGDNSVEGLYCAFMVDKKQRFAFMMHEVR